MRRNAKERYTTAKGTFKLYDKDGNLILPKAEKAESKAKENITNNKGFNGANAHKRRKYAH